AERPCAPPTTDGTGRSAPGRAGRSSASWPPVRPSRRRRPARPCKPRTLRRHRPGQGLGPGGRAPRSDARPPDRARSRSFDERGTRAAMSTPHGPAGAPGAVTIAQIAERAGVSIPTVSKVINGRADVAPATRERVEAAIRRSGYRRPSASGAARLVEITFHEFEGPFAIEIIKGVEQVAREHRLGVVVSELQGRLAPDHTWLADILERRPRGIVAVLSQTHSVPVERLAARGLPIVLVGPTGEPAHDTPSVGATNWSGGLSATGHRLDLGHRRIGVISGPETIPCGQARLEGHRAALRAAGIPLEAELVRHGDFRVEGGR